MKAKILLLTTLMSFKMQQDKIVKASWYGPGFHGRYTANGEVYDQNKISAAHKTLPFGTKVEITNIENNKRFIVIINDRGSYWKDRVFDLSKAAFSKIANINTGVIKLKYKIVN